MKNLNEYINEGAGHAQKRLGGGSSGVVYDLGNGKVRKTLRVLVLGSNDVRSREFEIINKWAKIKKGLKVISYIEDWDYEGYTMEKISVPCEEGDLITKVLYKCLYSADRKDWSEKNIQKAIDMVGEEDAKFVMCWLDDFCDDFRLITGSKVINDDIKSTNIGKDKKGNIKCIDWFDPYC